MMGPKESKNIFIEQIIREDKNCGFCSAVFDGYSFVLNAYSDSVSIGGIKSCFEYLFGEYGVVYCCVECGEIITGMRLSERLKVRAEYDKSFDEFRSIPWMATSNPLLMTKVWSRRSIGLMRDKFGRHGRYGVMLGCAERWRWREKHERYEAAESSAIKSVEVAEYVAFRWVDFVDFFGVSPEDECSLSDFNRLAESFKKGIIPASMQEM